MKNKYVVKTLSGLEEILAQELKELNGENITKINRAVSFYGDKALMYRANISLHTALSILKPIGEFNAVHHNHLYKNTKKIDWEEYLSADKTFRIDATVFSKVFTHSQFTMLRVKDAIVDYFNEKNGKRPSIDTVNPDLIIDLHIFDTQVTISLNSSGKPLNQRGYRRERGTAPLNEVLGAGMLSLAEADKTAMLIDPMCGSGTLLIEAAFLKGNIPASINRDLFAFQKWNDFDKKIWSTVKKDMLIQKIKGLKKLKELTTIDNSSFVKPVFFGSDISDAMLKKAAINIKQAGLEDVVTLKHIRIEDLTLRKEKKDFPKLFINGGTVITNPPYGKRIEADIKRLYKQLGSFAKFNLPKFSLWIISPEKDGLKAVGLKPDEKLKLNNGNLKCSFNRYTILPLKIKTDQDKKPAE